MSARFSETEKKLRKLFSSQDSFVYKNVTYNIMRVGKPSPSKGECKTDIYVLAETKDHEPREFKISVKQKNADFIGNKIRLERAIEIFGDDAQSIIFTHTRSIHNEFLKEPLVFFHSKNRTRAKSITLGWKFEIMNKSSGNKSGLLSLTKQQKLEIYAGTNLSKDKKNSKIGQTIISNSGVANFILVVDANPSEGLDYYVKQLIPVEEFVKNKNLYFACKALNYRADPDKWDGNRPLCVYVDWQLRNGKLYANLVYNNPLETKGNEVGSKIQKILKELKIDKNNFSDLNRFLDKDVNKYIK